MTSASIRGATSGRLVNRARATLSVAAVALVCLAAGCGQGGTPPNAAVDNYVSALGEGDFSLACSMLTSAARASIARSIGPHATCVAALNRCVPRFPSNSSKDQTQLLYANVQSTVTGRRAVAVLSGTVIATVIKRVDLVEVRGNWTLASSGDGLKRCLLQAHRQRRRSVAIRS